MTPPGRDVALNASGPGALIMKVAIEVVPPPGAGVTTDTLALPTDVMSEAAIAAVIWVALTRVVVRLLPFHCTTEFESKPLPLTVSVKADPPTIADVGEIDVTAGTGLLTERSTAAEVPPPGLGFTAVTGTIALAAMSAAVIAAVSWVAPIRVVVRGLPFHRTTVFESKPLPLTVNVKAAPPTTAVVGEMLVTVGSALLMGRSTALDVPPPGAGFTTVTGTVALEAISAAVIDAVNWVALRYVVVRLLPFQSTVDPEMKLAPVTVKVNAGAPAVADAGDIELTVGTGFVGGTLLPPPPPPQPASITAERSPGASPLTTLVSTIPVSKAVP